MDFGHKKPRFCSCCDTRILTPESRTCDEYRLMIFEMSDGSETPVSLCNHCAEEDWYDPERLLALKAQMNDAYALSVNGQMYALLDNGEWEIRTTSSALSPEVAQQQLTWYTSLRLIKPKRVGRFFEPEQMRILG